MIRDNLYIPRPLSLQDLFYFQKAPIRFLNQVAYSEGDVAGFQLFNQRLWVIRQPELADTLIKNSSFVKHALFKELYPVTGPKGLVQLNNAEWQLRIPTLKPPFSIPGVNEFLPLIRANIETMSQQLHSGPVDIYPLIMKMTMNNILVMLGIEGRPDVTAIIEDMLALNKLCGNRMRQLVRLPLFLPLQAHRSVKQKTRELRSKLHRLLETASIRQDSALAQFQQQWPISECLDNLSTFLFAGFETTSSSIVTALYFLAREPQLQEAIREEGRYSGALSVQVMRQWSWAHALYCETLRLYPPAYMLARQPAMAIQLGDYAFKPKDLVVVNVHGMQRHEDYWPNPRVFDAGRHLQQSPFANKAFMPFGLGKRICTGHQLAMTESMLTLSLLCQRFRLSTSNLIKPVMNAEITLHPRSQLWLHCEPR